MLFFQPLTTTLHWTHSISTEFFPPKKEKFSLRYDCGRAKPSNMCPSPQKVETWMHSLFQSWYSNSILVEKCIIDLPELTLCLEYKQNWSRTAFITLAFSKLASPNNTKSSAKNRWDKGWATLPRTIGFKPPDFTIILKRNTLF